jgi:hypothetical protein
MHAAPIRTLALLLAATVMTAPALSAQDSGLMISSPYTEIRNGRYIEAIGGRIFGDGGPIPVAPQDGNVYGGRVVFRAKNTVQLAFGAWTANTERFIVNADDSVATRVSGPVPQRLTAGEASVQMNLTGGKRWNAFGPFIGVGLGLVRGANSPAADTSTYSFGTKFFFVPNVGTRIFLGQRAYAKVEARALFWKIKYPGSYTDEPASQPGTIENPNAVNPTGKRGEYVVTPAIFVGLGVSF